MQCRRPRRYRPRGLGPREAKLAAGTAPAFVIGGRRPWHIAASAAAHAGTPTDLSIPSVQKVQTPVENRSPLGLPRIRS